MADDDRADAEGPPARRAPDGLHQFRLEVRRLVACCLDPRRGAELGAALDDEALRLRLAIVLGDAPAIVTSRRTCTHLLAALSAAGPPRNTPRRPARRVGASADAPRGTRPITRKDIA